MQCSWRKFQGTEHFVRDREMFEIECSRDRESPLYMLNYETLSKMNNLYYSYIEVLIDFINSVIAIQVFL